MKLNAIRVIIFDFDGVIADTGTDIALSVNKALEHVGVPALSKEQIIGFVGYGPHYLFENCLRGNEHLIKDAYPFYLDYYLKNSTNNTVLYKNVKETLEHFKDRFMGVVSNKPEDLTNKILGLLGVSQYFKLVLGPESMENLKPHPEGLLKVMDKAGERPENAIMIGDSYTDVIAARAAGTYACGVTYGLGSKERLAAEKPDLLIDDMWKLTELI